MFGDLRLSSTSFKKASFAQGMMSPMTLDNQSTRCGLCVFSWPYCAASFRDKQGYPFRNTIRTVGSSVKRASDQWPVFGLSFAVMKLAGCEYDACIYNLHGFIMVFPMFFHAKPSKLVGTVVGLTSHYPCLELRQAVNSCPTLMAIYFEWATFLQSGRCHKRQTSLVSVWGKTPSGSTSHSIYTSKNWRVEAWKSIMDVQLPFCHFITVNGCTNFQMGNIMPQLQDRMLIMLIVERWNFLHFSKWWGGKGSCSASTNSFWN